MTSAQQRRLRRWLGGCRSWGSVCGEGEGREGREVEKVREAEVERRRPKEKKKHRLLMRGWFQRLPKLRWAFFSCQRCIAIIRHATRSRGTRNKLRVELGAEASASNSESSNLLAASLSLSLSLSSYLWPPRRFSRARPRLARYRALLAGALGRIPLTGAKRRGSGRGEAAAD